MASKTDKEELRRKAMSYKERLMSAGARKSKNVEDRRRDTFGQVNRTNKGDKKPPMKKPRARPSAPKPRSRPRGK